MHVIQRSIIVDPILMSRYNAPSPCYTCYPEVAHFDPRVGDGAYRACAQRTNEDPIPASLSLKIRWGTDRGIELLDSLGYLDREIELQAALFDRDRPLERVVWDEEILSHLGHAQWRELLLIIAQNFNIERNPRLWASIRASALDPLKMRELKELPLQQLTMIADGEHALSNCIGVLQGPVELQPAQGSMWLAFEFEQHFVRGNTNSFLQALDQVSKVFYTFFLIELGTRKHVHVTEQSDRCMNAATASRSDPV